VLATGWHNGGPIAAPAGYGLAISKADRDRYFHPDWREVVLDLGAFEVIIPLSASFWRDCPELRSADIGAWLLEAGAAPWPRRSPPGVVVHHAEGIRFTARLLARPSFI
jgi:hypothetical protein